MHHTEVNSTNTTPNNSKSSSCDGPGHSWHNKHRQQGQDNKSIAHPNHISLPNNLWQSLPASARSSISQHTWQYNVTATQQNNTGHIPKVLGEQLSPHAKSAIANAQCHNKQEANSTTAHPNDQTDHSITNTRPMFTSNSVHYLPMDKSPNSNNNILNSITSSSNSTSSNTCSIDVHSGNHVIHSNGSSYTVNLAHVTYWCSQAISDCIGSLIDSINGGLAGTDVHMLNYTE